MTSSPGGVLLPELSDRVDELERQLRELRDTPQDTISTSNTFLINSKGEAEGPASGAGEGLNPFTDKFATEESLANYQPVATEEEREPSLSFSFGASGMTINPLAAGIAFVFLLQPYRGTRGGRCLDHISIMRYHIGGEAIFRRIGNVTRVKTQLTGPHKTGAYNAWQSLGEGLAGSNGIDTQEHNRKWVKAGKQESLSAGGHVIEPKFGLNTDLWIVTGVFGTTVYTQMWAVNPLTATIEAKPVEIGEMGTPFTGENGQLPGLNWATPGDVGMYIRGGAGDIVKEWTIFPLSWK